MRYSLRLGLAALAVLPGCSDALADAEERLELARKQNDLAGICREHQKLATAYLEARDLDRFKSVRDEADSSCLRAQTANSTPPVDDPPVTNRL